MRLRLRVQLARLIEAASRFLEAECPYCRQRVGSCWCRGRDWLP